MKRLWAVWAVLVASVALAADNAKPPTTDEQITRAIEQLGAADYPKREAATRFLWSAGKAAEPKLREAALSKDPEVATRANEVLTKIHNGIRPDTPTEISDLVAKYWRSTAEERPPILAKLLAMGEKAIPVVHGIAENEADKGVLQEAFGGLSVSALAIQGQIEMAEMVLRMRVKAAEGERREMVEESETSDVFRNYAAYLLLNGQLDEKLREWRTRTEQSHSPLAARLLAHLYRVKRDGDNACWAARQTQDEKFVDNVLHDFNCWKELSGRRTNDGTTSGNLDELGLIAAYHRLAGNQEEFEKVIRRMQALQTAGTNSLFSFETMTINERPQDAVQFAICEHGHSQAFELLAFQRRFRAALALVGHPTATNDWSECYLPTQAARLYHDLGEKDRAVALLHSFESKKQLAANGWALTRLVGAQVACGLTNEAVAVVAEVIARLPLDRQQSLLHVLAAPPVPADGRSLRIGAEGPSFEAVFGVWQVLGTNERYKELPIRLHSLMDVFNRRIPAEHLAELVAQAVQRPQSTSEPNHNVVLLTLV